MPLTQTLSLTSKPAVYSYGILKLSCFAKEISCSDNLKSDINSFISNLKKSFENHSQDITDIVLIFSEDLKKHSLSNNDKTFLFGIIRVLMDSVKLNLTRQEKFENRFQRRFESHFATNLILEPTASMMESVLIISERLCEVIDSNQASLFNRLLQNVSHNPNIGDCFGHGDWFITLPEIKNILLKNEKNNLMKIMLIHFLIWWCLKSPEFNQTVNFAKWKYPPLGKFSDLIQLRLKEYNSSAGANLSEYIDLIKNDTHEIKFLSDQHMYSSPLYLDRGRGSKTRTMSNCMGLMLIHQEATYFKNISSEKQLGKWVPDVLNMRPNYNSNYLKSILDNDGVYVSGASGIASMLLAQMEIVGNLQSIQMKQQYLLAIAAYIVAGGLHSLHEVIAPAQYSLNLVPGYNAEPPNKLHNFKILPSNYNSFFLLYSHDDEFTMKRDKTWNDFLHYAAAEFKNDKPKSDFFKTLNLPTIKSVKADYPEVILKEIKKAINEIKALDEYKLCNSKLWSAIENNCHTLASATTVIISIFQFTEKRNIKIFSCSRYTENAFSVIFLIHLKSHYENVFYYLTGIKAKSSDLSTSNKIEKLIDLIIKRHSEPSSCSLSYK